METENPDLLDREIDKVVYSLQQLLMEYTNLGSKVKTGEVHNTYFDEIFEFVNLRMESVDSAKTLLEIGRVSDALSLCRPLLEQYLLFKLICRGHKYYRLQNFNDKNLYKWKLSEAKEKSKDPEVPYVKAKKHGRSKQTIQYEFEGLKYDDPDSLRITFHYFLYQEHNPQAQNLRVWDYYSAIPIDEDFQKALEDNHKNAKFVYKSYLSYSSIKDCLLMNNLSSKRTEQMIDAHYTFLGHFIHPSNRVSRSLHLRSNVHEGNTGIGLSNSYSRESILLAYLYLLNLAQGLIEECVYVLDAAPKKNIESFDSGLCKELLREQRDQFSYFWFLSHQAPAFDKFRTLGKFRDPKAYSENYLEVPDAKVPFDYDVYGRFVNSRMSWTTMNGVEYKSPLI